MADDLQQIQQALRAIKSAVLELRTGRLAASSVEERLDTIVHGVRQIERHASELDAELRRERLTARGESG
jgi:hypothetical protein